MDLIHGTSVKVLTQKLRTNRLTAHDWNLPISRNIYTEEDRSFAASYFATAGLGTL